MSEILRSDEFSIRAIGGQILLDAPGLVATLDVDAASFLSDQLFAACEAAKRQQRKMADDDRPIDWV